MNRKIGNGNSNNRLVDPNGLLKDRLNHKLNHGNGYNPMANFSMPQNEEENIEYDEEGNLIEKEEPSLGDKINDTKKQVKQYAKEVAKEEVKKQVKAKIIGFIAKNPYVLAIIGGIIVVIILIMLILGIQYNKENDLVEGDFLRECNYNITSVEINNDGNPTDVGLKDYVIRELYNINKNIELNDNAKKTLMIILKTNILSNGNYNNSTKKVIDNINKTDYFSLESSSEEYKSLELLYNDVENYLYLKDSYSGSLTTLSQSDALILDETIIEKIIEMSANENYQSILKELYSIDSNYIIYDLERYCEREMINPEQIGMSGGTGFCDTSTPDANIFTFINNFEGSGAGKGGYCDSNKKNYKAEYGSNDNEITIGHGVTVKNVISSSYAKEYIEKNNYQKYFKTNTNGLYYLVDGDCVPTNIIDELSVLTIQNVSGGYVDTAAKNHNVTLTPFQRDALISFAYNYPRGAEFAVAGYKNEGYEGLWKYMKQIVNSKDGPQPGLFKRRKAEFALFVTGDYTDQGKFNNRPNSIPDYDNYDSEGVMARINKCDMTQMGDGLYLDPNTNFKLRNSRPLRTNSIYYDQNNNQLAYTDYEGECAWYAGHRAKEILAVNNSSKQWNSMPDGKAYCNTSEVTSGTFKSSTNPNNPRVGALVSWNYGTWGHVAVIEKVNPDGSVDISEGSISNGIVPSREVLNNDWTTRYGGRREARKHNCEGNNSGCFNYRNMPISQLKSGFVCYIYLLD